MDNIVGKLKISLIVLRWFLGPKRLKIERNIDVLTAIFLFAF